VQHGDTVETVAPMGVVLVSGGSSGLGAAVVDVVARAGGKPVVLDRVEPQRSARGESADFEPVDLADGRATERTIARLAERLGHIDGVVTCAGIDACGTLADVPADEWERVLQVNLLGTVAVVRAALPSLYGSRGRVVTVASTLGVRAVSDATAYCASKFGVVGFTRALAAETQGKIGVTLLIPGGMATPFFDGRTEQYKPPPDLVMNDPANVASAVVFALRQPLGCEVRELVVCPSIESSWP
jgi:NAD(P)-dependent dehydrogenase (short-subunit alcohol dehydrogenase family)